MGLDLHAELMSPDHHVHFSYGSFAEFRRRLAEDGLGVPLDSMKGFGGERLWSDFESDPLAALLNHSDCDGYLEDLECEGLAVRLRGVVAKWEDDPYMHDHGLRFADLIAAVESDGGRVVFA